MSPSYSYDYSIVSRLSVCWLYLHFAYFTEFLLILRVVNINEYISVISYKNYVTLKQEKNICFSANFYLIEMSMIALTPSTGNKQIIKSDPLSEPIQGPPEVIFATFLLSFVEGLLLILVVHSTWSSYAKIRLRAAMRRLTICGFLRKLSLIRKVRIIIIWIWKRMENVSY